MITLIPADFDSLNIPVGWVSMNPNGRKTCQGQYSKPTDCPVYRALKRMGVKVHSVGPDYVITEGKKMRISGGFVEVERCRIELQQGNKEAHIKTI